MIDDPFFYTLTFAIGAKRVWDGLVLYLLRQSGLTIIQVLAVTVFVALLLVVGVAPYAGRLFEWLETQLLPAMLRDQWLYVIVWVLLLAWGAVELIMAR
ncbi:MAG: hypothetical protein OEP48_11180 [Betaproteobacteria bacterium]|nr:hypothetical protein [Betaproteobacteria bacterium]MDH3436734.1 hypothetical protein [Betaproteobacteria bacterium]